MSVGTVENGQEIATTQPAKIPPREIRVVHDDGPLANLLDTGRFEHMYRIASVMGMATVLPDHLRLDPKTKAPLSDERVKANCTLVVNQALRWGFDPFALAGESYVVGGKLAFQGKLIAAVVNARAGIEGRLSARYNDGKGNDLKVTISGKFPDEPEAREIEVTVGEARTPNEMWNKDPRQKLWYTGAIKWARRHCPEVLMGVLTDDDVERIHDRGNSDAVRVIDSEVIPAGQSKAESLRIELERRREAARGEEPHTPANGEESQDAPPDRQPTEAAGPGSEAPTIEQEIAGKISAAIATASDIDRMIHLEQEAGLLTDDALRIGLYAQSKARREALAAMQGGSKTKKQGTLT